jgi:hypothetical protein
LRLITVHPVVSLLREEVTPDSLQLRTRVEGELGRRLMRVEKKLIRESLREQYQDLRDEDLESPSDSSPHSPGGEARSPGGGARARQVSEEEKEDEGGRTASPDSDSPSRSPENNFPGGSGGAPRSSSLLRHDSLRDQQNGARTSPRPRGRTIDLGVSATGRGAQGRTRGGVERGAVFWMSVLILSCGNAFPPCRRQLLTVRHGKPKWGSRECLFTWAGPKHAILGTL